MKKIIVLIIAIISILFAQTPSNTFVQNWINNYTGFEENLGQITDIENNPVPSILFKMNLTEYNIFITENGVSFVINQHDKELINFARFDIEPVNGTIDKNQIELYDEIPGGSNYYLAHCPNGVLSVKSYRYIKIKDLYPGIDWIWRFDNKVHNEFEVKPNADIRQIKLKVKWADTEIKDGKDIIYSTPLGKINEGRLIVYQKDRQNISASYQKDADGLISFDIKQYDKNKTLIIDPPFARLWATYYGGSGQENCDGSRMLAAMTADNAGNIFLTGFTSSSNFPTYNPGGGVYFQGTYGLLLDVFIVKFSSTGQREWATYYGGTADEEGIAITTDRYENVFVTGVTFSSTNFPVYDPGSGAYFQSTGGGSGDVFILKFTNAGVRLWATYYGGNYSDVGYSIATDNVGNVFVTGNTMATNMPTFDAGGGAYYQASNAGSFDAFILKFSNTGVRQWATYYGGTDDDNGYGIAVDTSGNVFVTGMTRSTNFPILDAGSGAYYQTSILGYRTVCIMKFTNNGVRLWSTYYGGSTNDYGLAIAINKVNKVYVTGNTSSTNFPVFDMGSGAYYQATTGGSDDAFILRFSDTGIREWATFYGGSSGDIARTITTDDSGNIFIAGNTLSSNFPTYDPGNNAYYQSTLTGGHEIFIVGFSSTSARRWATFYGGTSTDYGMSIVTDNNDNIYLTGFSLSSNFPTYNPGGSAYFQGTNAGSYDAYVLKFASASTGIEEHSKFHASRFTFQVFPNPASSYFDVRLPLNAQLLNCSTLKLYDVTGKLVREVKLPNGSLTSISVSTNGIKNGIYFIKVGDELIKDKLVVTK